MPEDGAIEKTPSGKGGCGEISHRLKGRHGDRVSGAKTPEVVYPEQSQANDEAIKSQEFGGNTRNLIGMAHAITAPRRSLLIAA